MIRCLRRECILIIICFTALVFRVQASPDSLGLPEPLLQQLKEYRENDDLAGWIYSRIGYTDADPAQRTGFLAQTQQAAWRSYKNYEERLAWFDLLSLQGYYPLQSGNILASTTAYEAALQFYESYPLPEIDIIETVLKPLGNNYTRLADYTTALYIHQKTLTLAQKRNDANMIASVYSNMAACARWKGDLDLAVTSCAAGIKQVSKPSALYGLLLGTYADVLTEQDRFDTAAVVCRQSLQQLQQFQNNASVLYWYTSSLQTAARIALNKGEFSKATQYANKTLQLFHRYYPSSRQREKAKLQVLLGDISLQTNKPQNALQYYHGALIWLLPEWRPGRLNAVPPENQLYSENTFGDALAGKAAAFEAMDKKKEALACYFASFAAERKLRSAFFYTESKYKELQVTRNRSNTAMRLAIKALNETGDTRYFDQLLLIAELSKAQVLLDERNRRSIPANSSGGQDSMYTKAKQLQEAINYYQHELVQATNKKAIDTLLRAAEYELALLNKKMNRQTTHSYSETLLTTESLNQLINKLPPGITVLEFYEGADSSYIIELDAGGIQHVHVVASGRNLRNSIQQFMQQWFAGGPQAMINNPKKFYADCHNIYATIFGNFKWVAGKRYILVPDGIFNYLPFDALVTEPGYRNDYSQWPFLFKKVSLSRAWSLQMWFEQQEADYHKGPFTGFFVARTNAGELPQLSVEEEYRLLKKMIAGDFYLDSSATWNHFNTVADSASVLHIGSHALSSTTDSFPSLQLFDKPFYLFDLRYKNFAPALVMLSACKTADGLLLTGEGVNSLSRGFTAAGAGGVVSGLWNVNDETAVAFTQLFYQQLKQHDAAMALQQAKQQWLQEHRNNPVLQLPYYWAGFTYSGHLKNINLSPPVKSRWYYAAGVLVVLGIAFTLVRVRRKQK